MIPVVRTGKPQGEWTMARNFALSASRSSAGSCGALRSFGRVSAKFARARAQGCAPEPIPRSPRDAAARAFPDRPESRTFLSATSRSERCSGPTRSAGAVTELDRPRARDFTTAANAAWRFVREPPLRLAFKDLGFSLRDRGDDAFLYAYRAVENARRFHADKVSATERKPVWPPLHAALGTSEEQLRPLTDAATSIRHGDTKSAALATARVNRDATLVLAEDVLRRLAQHEGV
ncbi:MAG: hypothetical protein ACRDNN_16680, partial [Gaiellaceae bacterium]